VSITAESIPEPCEGESYEATVLLEQVTFALGQETVLLPSLTIEDVRVGWCAG
jgi:hypothetical protein